MVLGRRGSSPAPKALDVRTPALAEITTFELDADGDGTFERWGSTAVDIEGEQIFGRRGTYTLTLRVSDPLGVSREKLTLGPAVPVPLQPSERAYWAALRPGTDEVFAFGAARLISLDSRTGESFQIGLPREDLRPEWYFQVSFDWSRDGRFLYLATESGFFVVDAVTRSVASHVPTSIAPGCDFVVDPTEPRAFVVQDAGVVTELDLLVFPPR